MDSVFQAIDWTSALLVTGAVGLVAFSAKDLAAAKLITWIVVALTLFRWGAWAMISETPWYLRMIVGALVGGFLAAAVPSSLRWIELKAVPLDQKDDNKTSGAQNYTEPSVQTPPKPQNAFTPRHNIEINNNTIVGAKTGISAPKDTDLGAAGNRFENTEMPFELRDVHEKPHP